VSFQICYIVAVVIVSAVVIVVIVDIFPAVIVVAVVLIMNVALSSFSYLLIKFSRFLCWLIFHTDA